MDRYESNALGIIIKIDRSQDDFSLEGFFFIMVSNKEAQNSLHTSTNCITIKHSITFRCRVLCVVSSPSVSHSFIFESFKEKYSLIKCFYFQRFGKFTPPHFRQIQLYSFVHCIDPMTAVSC